MRFRKLVVLLIVVGVLAGGASLAYAAFNPPTPQDLLTRAANAALAVQDGHALVQMESTTPRQSGSATVEVWGKKVADGAPPIYAVRAEVRESTFAEAQGGVLVSDGHQFWAYAPARNTVWTGSIDEMRQAHGNVPATDPQALVQRVFEYATVTLLGNEQIQGRPAYKLQLAPLSDRVPPALVGVTGLLWLDSARLLPLQATIDAGALGQGRLTATTLETNIGVPAERFQFQPPAGAQVTPVRNQKPQHLSLGDIDQAAGFRVLKPAYLPAGATLVDVMKMGQGVALRYEAPAGSFAVAQGVELAALQLPAGGKAAVVRGVEGLLLAEKNAGQTMLLWTENGRTFFISGALSAEEALKVAESLQ